MNCIQTIHISLHILYKVSKYLNPYHKNKDYCHQQNNRLNILLRKKQPLIKILKCKRPSIEPCGIPFTIFVESLNVEPILILSCLIGYRTLLNGVNNLHKTYCVLST